MSILARKKTSQRVYDMHCGVCHHDIITAKNFISERFGKVQGYVMMDNCMIPYVNSPNRTTSYS